MFLLKNLLFFFPTINSCGMKDVAAAGMVRNS
jgi:hypothetical protein